VIITFVIMPHDDLGKTEHPCLRAACHRVMSWPGGGMEGGGGPGMTDGHRRHRVGRGVARQVGPACQ
jgi:hypothetical protein